MQKNRESIDPSKPYIVAQTRFFIAAYPFRTFTGSHVQHFEEPTHLLNNPSRICKRIPEDAWKGEEEYEDNGFTSHIYSDGCILFKLHNPEHRKLLSKLTDKQSSYIVDLYYLHAKAINNNTQLMHLSPDQVTIHLTLPSFMHYYLEKNYRLAEIQEIRKRERKAWWYKYSPIIGTLATFTLAGIYAAMPTSL